jgi:hypothetical protein
MRPIANLRCFAIVILLGSGVGFAQSTLPATSPTSTSPPTGAMSTPAAVDAVVAPKAGHRALVMYAQGQLTVIAENSSLSEILRDISRQTAMKIIGNLTDERVYGKYGPGTPNDVLASLLNGTSSNMLLRETAANEPAELILTPRLAASPAGPDGAVSQDRSDSEDRNLISAEQLAPVMPPPPVPHAQFSPGSSDGRSTSSISPTGYVPPRAGYPGAPGSSAAPGGQAPQGSAGVGTPSQIYQQLQQLQSQQAATP